MMRKRPKTTPGAAEAQAALHAEEVLRSGMLYRYLKVIARHDDVLLIEPRHGHRLSVTHEVGTDRRVVRIVVSPIPPPGKRV